MPFEKRFLIKQQLTSNSTKGLMNFRCAKNQRPLFVSQELQLPLGLSIRLCLFLLPWSNCAYCEQPLDFPVCFCLPCVCLGDLGASVRFSTVSSTKRSSNLSVHKVSILSWSLFFEKGCINRLGSYLSISVRVGQNLYVSPQPYGCQILFPKITVRQWSCQSYQWWRLC